VLSHTSLFTKHPVCCHIRPCLQNTLCAVTYVHVALLFERFHFRNEDHKMSVTLFSLKLATT
jgi:hypothetical protein